MFRRNHFVVLIPMRDTTTQDGIDAILARRLAESGAEVHPRGSWKYRDMVSEPLPDGLLASPLVPAGSVVRKYQIRVR